MAVVSELQDSVAAAAGEVAVMIAAEVDVSIVAEVAGSVAGVAVPIIVGPVETVGVATRAVEVEACAEEVLMLVAEI